MKAYEKVDETTGKIIDTVVSENIVTLKEKKLARVNLVSQIEDVDAGYKENRAILLAKLAEFNVEIAALEALGIKEVATPL